MTLRTRIFLIVCMALIALIVGVYALSSTILMSGFRHVEDTYGERNVRRAEHALAAEVSALDTKSSDWATWDDTCEFIANPSDTYIESNLAGLAAFNDLGVNFILYFDAAGRLVYAKGVDLESETEAPVPEPFLAALVPGHPLLKHDSVESSVTGIVPLQEGPLMVASRPITTSERGGPIRGSVIFARYLDDEIVSRLSQVTDVAVSIHRLGGEVDPDVATAIGAFAKGESVHLERLGPDRIAGYTQVRGVNGKPILVLRTLNDRAIHAQGLVTMRYLVGALVVVGLATALVAVLLLDRLVLSRLSRVAADVQAVGAASDLSARVHVEGRDELSALATTINLTLEALESSQRQLAGSEQRLALVLDAMSEGVWDRDLATGRTYLSPQWLASLGYTRDDVGDNPDFRRGISHPDDVQRVEEAMKAHLEGRTPAYECENRLRMKSGRWRWNIERGKVVERDADGKPLRMVGTDRDITDRRRLEQQFFQAQKMEAVGKLAGGIAHDFNNLLTIIVGHADMLRAAVPETGRMRRNAEEIAGAAQKAASLTRQLLAFSRNQTLQLRVIDLRAVVDSIESMLSRIIGEDILLKTVRSASSAYVKADVSQLEQVLVNMAVNARDAMASGGQLVIEIGEAFVSADESPGDELPPGEYAVLEITDSGAGMTEQVRARVFEPFFTTKEPGKGTGLGLASCYGIVKQSGGHIAVRSELGKGTTFSVYLPRAEGPTVATSAPPPRPQRMPGGDETILVVEDEACVRELAVEVLRSLGYCPLEAADGVEAQGVATAFGLERIDLVLTDVVMPNMGGKEFRDWFVARRPDAKVLFVSGYTSDAFGPHGIHDDGVWLLEKPFTPSALAGKVREILDESFASAEAGGRG